MNLIWKDGKIHIDEGGKVLDPTATLSEDEAKRVFELCRDHQELFGDGSKGEVLREKVNFILPKTEKVVFFPGSFAPWHKGHRACVANLPENLSVVVLPDFNPWKKVREDGLWSEAREIWNGLSELAKDRKDLNISLYLGFLASQSINPTIQWLPKAIGRDKWFLMGEDTFLGLHKWKDADKVLAALKGLYVCPRAIEEERVLEQKKQIMEMVQHDLTIEFLAPHPYQEFSSTWARENKL